MHAIATSPSASGPADNDSAGASVPSARPPTTQRRQDIEGLRGVAALLVAIYHIWTHRLSGAVDVFFFVSAYVMVMSVLRRIDTGRRFSVKGSYRDLFFRMGPHVWVVVAVTTCAGWVLMSSSYWQAIRDQAIAAVLFVVNEYFAVNSLVYLGAGTQTSLVQHLWAMGVQVQFYLVFPLLVWVSLLIGKQHGARGQRIALTVVFSVVAVASFMYARYAIINFPSAAYFDTFARAWQFAAGAVFAILAPLLRANRWLSWVAGWVGFVVLCVFGVVYDATGMFPGTMAIVPVGAAALIMFAGQGGGVRVGPRHGAKKPVDAREQRTPFGVDRLLAWRPMTWLGSYSFGLYLWHWPVLALVRSVTGESKVSLATGLGVIAIAVGLSWVSTKFVAVVIRTWSRSDVRRIRFRATAASLVLLLCAVGVAAGVNRSSELAIAAAPKGNPGAEVLFNPALKANVKGLQPAFAFSAV